MQLNGIACPACGGGGHYPWDCATIHGLNKLARAHSVQWEWGALKGGVYYQAWVAANPDVVAKHNERKAKERRNGSRYGRN